MYEFTEEDLNYNKRGKISLPCVKSTYIRHAIINV